MTQKTERAEALKIGCLVIPDRLASSLPLEHTRVTIQVSGPLASAVVTQRFGNPMEQAVDLEYLYPLPEDAAITDFELTIGERTIRAELKESGEAGRDYEDARQGGKRAGLFEQRRPNLFAVRLANVQPGETIQATVRYQQRLAFNEDGYELVFPLGLTPKYDSPEHAEDGAGVHAPLARRDEKIGPVEIHVTVDAGLPCADPRSPSHAIELIRLDERRFQVQLAGHEIPDHDFVLRFSPLGSLAQTSAWLGETPDGQYFMASLLPPRAGDEPPAAPREFIFVLDRSGSMGGEPIAQARNALRACLRSLNPADTFRILLFDNQLEWYRPEASPVNQGEVDLADRFLEHVDARGGTEIMGALEAALGQPPDPKRSRLVVFLTDGAVSAELRTLDLLRSKLGSARIFTFGIGPAVNRALLNRMAGLGRGMAEFLLADEDIEGAIMRFQDRISFPVLTDVQIHIQGGTAWDIYPARLPDLYAGQPLAISGRAKADGSGPLAVVLSARRGDELVSLQGVITEAKADGPAIARMWARARIDDLLDEAALAPERAETIRAAVIELALAHRLVTQFTAMVGIDQSGTVGDSKALTIQVALPLPRGLDWQSLPSAGGMPRMALMQQNMLMSMPAAAMTSTGMRRRKNISHSLAESGELHSRSMPMPDKTADAGAHGSPEASLRWLARTQQLDGSWDGSVERTSAALLAFVRAGHTSRQGGFRTAVRRAAAWLLANEGQGTPRYYRARALEELAAATGLAAHQEQAREARQRLPEPANALEQAASGGPVSAQNLASTITKPDELRLAVLAKVKPVVEVGVFTGDLEMTWLACL